MCQKKSSSSFVFGIILGAIIGAVIAIVIYKKSKGKVIEDLQNWLTGFFVPQKVKKNKSKKPAVEIIESIPVAVPVRKKSRPKVFIRK